MVSFALHTPASSPHPAAATTPPQRCEVKEHCLNSSGGASGVAHSIVLFAERHELDAVVLGSRGLGPFRSALASLVGQGSVSAYCLHRLSCAVAIVRGDPTALEANPVEPAVMVAVDGSPESQVALDWVGATPFPVDATFHLVTARSGDGDLVRWRKGVGCDIIVYYFLWGWIDECKGQRLCVIMRSASVIFQQCALFTYPFTGYFSPHPSSLIAQLQVTQPESPSARVLELREKAERTALLDAAATRVLEEAGSRLEEAGVGIGRGQRRTVSSLTLLKGVLTQANASPYPPLAQVPEDAVVEVTLELEDEAVGPVLTHYGRPSRTKCRHRLPNSQWPRLEIANSLFPAATEHMVTAAVLGARDLGSIKRAMLSLLGSGSVSEYVMQHLPLPVIVVRRKESAHDKHA